MTDDEEIVRELREEWGPQAAAALERLQPDPEVTDEILERILRTPRPRSAFRRCLSWIAAPKRIAGVTCALAAVVAVIILIAVAPWAPGPRPAHAATPDGMTYRPDPAVDPADLLGRIAGAAQIAGRPGAGGVEYVHTRSWDLNAHIDGGKVTTAVVPTEKRYWRAPDGTVVVIEQYGTAMFPDDRAKRAWEADGSPGSDTSPRRTEYPPGEYKLFWPDRPPTDPRLLRSWLGRDHDVADSGQLLVAVVDLLKERVLTGPERAAVLRLIAGLPGLEYTGSGVDRIGRPGEAFSVTSSFGGPPTRYTLVVDRETGRFLAFEQTLISGSRAFNVKVPAVISYVVFMSAEFTTRIA